MRQMTFKKYDINMVGSRSKGPWFDPWSQYTFYPLLGIGAFGYTRLWVVTPLGSL
jgi:hypothetical protein